MAKITYDNKETLNAQPSIANKNKVTSDDMNEIKEVVNENDDNIGTLSNLNTTDKSSIVGAINELKNAEIYSTTEVKTGKKWIDGKDIYRIVIDDTLGTSNNNWKQINVFSANYVDKVVSLEGIFSVSNGNFYNIPFTRITDSSFINKEFCLCNFDPVSGIYSIIAGSNNFSAYSGRPFTAIIEYTKTTD